jgi:Phage head-tail joining protein
MRRWSSRAGGVFFWEMAMPAKFGAGQMIELVAFDRREMIDDGYGNIIAGDWQEQFQHRAKFIYLHGSEAVMQGRMESRESIIMQVRICDETRLIDTDWQARDVRRGTFFNVRTVEEDKSRSLIDLLCEQGVATG